MGPSSSPLPDPVRLELPLPFPVETVNCWLLAGDPVTLVDPGVAGSEAIAGLTAALGDHGLTVEHVEQVVLTHHHDDHAGLAAEVRRRAGSRVVAHAAVAERLLDVPAQTVAGDAWRAAVLTEHGADPSSIAEVPAVSARSARWRASVIVDHVVHDGDVVRAGGHDLTVSLRPGHSPADTLFVAEAGWALLGDHLLASVAPPVLIERRDGVTDARERGRVLPRYREELGRTMRQVSGCGLPGHGAVVADVAAAVTHRLAEQDRRARRVLDRMPARPSTAWTLLRELWPDRDLSSDGHPVSIPFVVLCDVLGLLDLLRERGQVEERSSDRQTLFTRAG